MCHYVGVCNRLVWMVSCLILGLDSLKLVIYINRSFVFRQLYSNCESGQFKYDIDPSMLHASVTLPVSRWINRRVRAIEIVKPVKCWTFTAIKYLRVTVDAVLVNARLPWWARLSHVTHGNSLINWNWLKGLKQTLTPNPPKWWSLFPAPPYVCPRNMHTDVRSLLYVQ